ncbi:hypothetical protein GCM10010413_51940 [Promicromonospora sukumoe]|uniref:Uncharacterized protein n=1 Tax=Promicromonospora sukumoe TaxID=88382 RepID=A0A7W3JD46_9MICO|nr:hypothetical protein [Promicromonospora sukumoe]MBA8810640.1 hypothetical protein [Promicromonospora sukumoe]
MSTTTEQMDPQEYAALVRDANALVNAIETGITRTGFVFVSASALTVAHLAFGLAPVAQVLAAVAALAFLAAVVLVVTRISLGPVPEPLPEGPEAATGVAQVAQSPATGSGSATAENRVIPTK